MWTLSKSESYYAETSSAVARPLRPGIELVISSIASVQYPCTRSLRCTQDLRAATAVQDYAFLIVRRMSLCTVDFDTLSIIVAFLSPDDARSLSRTTRALHAIAQQRALSALTIRKPQVLTQAHKYLLDDIPARAHCLRELTVSFGAHNTTLEQVSPLVADLLENTPLLKHVSIDCAEDLILIEPRLWNALTALKFVTNVELIGAGPEVLRQLGELQGPLRRLAFRGQIEERLPPNQMPTIRLPFVDFVKAWHSYPHLKSVVLCDIGSLDDHPKEHRYAPCPNVTNLEVLRSYLAPSDMNAMFPNLRTLSFCHTGRPRADSTARSPEKCWTRLDSIRFRTVYAPKVHPWPLTSRVRRLDLVNVIETDTETYWSFPDIYLGVVERTQPIVLRLSTCPSIGENFWKRVLMAQRNVRCLDIRVRTNWRCHKDLGGWLVRSCTVTTIDRLTRSLCPRTRCLLSGQSQAWSMYASASTNQTSYLRCGFLKRCNMIRTGQ